jgi:hypothetical protein
MLVDDYIEILGIDCLVTAIDFTLLQFTIVSESNLETAQWWKAKKPYFDYEKILGESNTLLEKTNSAIYRLQKYPLIFLPLDIEQERDVDSAIQIQLKNVIFYILTSTENNNQYANWRLTNIFKTILIPIYEKFFEAIKISPYIYDKNNLINHLYIENYLQSDNNNNIFNEYTDAIQLRFSNISLINLSSSCDKFAIAPLPYIVFSYSNFSAVYADDADYNDVISCSLTVTNNTSIAQNCIVYLKHNDHFVQLEEVVTENTAYTFTYDFADVDIFVENIVTFHDSAMNQLSSVTIAATPEFEMYFEATDEMKTITIGLQRELFTSCVLNTGDGRYIDISNTISVYKISYTENKKYKLTFSNHLNIIYLYIRDQLVISANAHRQIYIYAGEIKKLKNLQVLTIYGSSAYPFSNVIAEEYELLKLKKLYYILLRCSINIGIGVIRKFAKELTVIRQHSNSGTITFLPDEFSDAFNITYLYLYNAPASRPMLSLQDGVIKNFTKNAYFYLYRVYYNVQPDDSFYDTTGIYFNACNLTSQSVDNAIIICANSGAMDRILYMIGGSTERRTHASDAALALLLSRGWTVTVLEPL